VLDLATRLPADLIVLGSHGWSTEEHTSVAERVLARSPCPVLTVHDPTAPPRAIAMRALPGHAPPEVVVPIDATDAAAAVAAYAFEVARALGPRLHLLHVEPTLSSAAHAATRRRLEAMIPPDLADRVECHVEAGEPVERIMDFLCERLPAYAIMGEHARGLFRRVFTRDTARELLHRAPCPVWFVPSR
jgi:nucleotide-binding universal stress UspA family protein